MEQKIANEIRDFVATSPKNRFPGSDEPIFAEPLVAFASASDQLFADYKTIIGEFHLHPRDLLPSAQSVVAWTLPIALNTRKQNRKESQFPCKSWAVTRTLGEQFNREVRIFVTSLLKGMGHSAVAPQLDEKWRELSDSPVGVASTWSERHALYACGLGTFSLSDGFITPKGIAHRCGTVLTDLALTPSPRPYQNYRVNCLYFRDGSCGLCIKRCPAGAITEAGHDKAKCREYVYGTAPKAVAEIYGVSQTGCGLCQTGVPCEGAIPK